MNEVNSLLINLFCYWTRNKRDCLALFCIKKLSGFLSKKSLLPIALFTQLKLNYKKTREIKQEIDKQTQTLGILVYANFIKKEQLAL